MSAVDFVVVNQRPSSSSSTPSIPSITTLASDTVVAVAATSALTHVLDDEERKVDELLVPALLGHEALPIHLKLLYDTVLPAYQSGIVQKVLTRCGWTPDDFARGYVFVDSKTGSIRTSWQCPNLLTTIQIINRALEFFPTMAPTIQSLQQSLTQTMLASFLNGASAPNNLEMPAAASLAPKNVCLPLLDSKPAPGWAPSSPAKSDGYVSSSLSVADSTSSSADGGQPIALGATVPPKTYKSFKKRVQCDKCLKTFCDKGALKIHNSSVHLREMHLCTVPGCTRQFPSKRSRNRHSNNPKMHTDAGRRRNCRTTVVPQTQSQSLPPPPPSTSEPAGVSPAVAEGAEAASPVLPPFSMPNAASVLQRILTAGALAPATPQTTVPSPLELAGLIRAILDSRQKTLGSAF